MRPDPQSIAICIPTNRGVDGFTLRGLCSLYRSGRVVHDVLLQGGSPVQIPRMLLTAQFLQSSCEWMVFLDDDVGFTIGDWDILWEETEERELAVCAEYLKKVEGHHYPATWGLGFARVHRSVFAKLRELRHPGGGEMVTHGEYFGIPISDYFPTGMFAPPKSAWCPEDHGFWTLVHQAKVATRLERRTRLIHTGTTHFAYEPNMIEQEPRTVAPMPLRHTQAANGTS